MSVGYKIKPTDFSHDNKGGGFSPLSPLDAIAGGTSSDLKRGASSAWDVLSGERDWERQKALQEETWRREDTAVQRGQRDLAAAGINPMLAGQYGGAPTSAPTAKSHSAESVGRIASMAGGVLSGAVNAKKALTELGLIRANTASTVANTANTINHMAPSVAKTVAQTALLEAQLPNMQADTALKHAQKVESGYRSYKHKIELPKYHSEADYYKRYGKSPFLARDLKNPWQASMFVSDRVEPTINSASSLLNKAVKEVKIPRPKVKSMRSTPYGF